MRKRFSLPTLVGFAAVSLLAGAMLNHVFSGDSIFDQLNKIKDVLSVTEKYYVEDGHHRVSVAQSIGMLFIQAKVWEYSAQEKGKVDCEQMRCSKKNFAEAYAAG